MTEVVQDFGEITKSSLPEKTRGCRRDQLSPLIAAGTRLCKKRAESRGEVGSTAGRDGSTTADWLSGSPLGRGLQKAAESRGEVGGAVPCWNSLWVPELQRKTLSSSTTSARKTCPTPKRSQGRRWKSSRCLPRKTRGYRGVRKICPTPKGVRADGGQQIRKS